MRNTRTIYQNWLFCEGQDVLSTLNDRKKYQSVELPHNAVDVPLNYFDERKLHQAFTYHYQLYCDGDALNKQQVMRFEGAMCDAHVYVNGTLVKHHPDGYTGFDALLSPALKTGDNLITVTLSGEENPAIPPFGGRIDYLCFPGLYRGVTLSSFDRVRINNVKVETRDVLIKPKVDIAVHLQEFEPYEDSLSIDVALFSPENECMTQQSAEGIKDISAPIHVCFDALEEIVLWDIEQPALYRVEVKLNGNDVSDAYDTRFGFREAAFTEDGFFLNGKRLQLIGINRHQSYPYVGYAMGKRGQQLDAEIIRNELGMNLVRTSHYPQSPEFIDRCDELGLLVFEEITGWQHVGDKKWQQESINNVQRMIERDWNHPSIILWGVRINESQDDHDFYTQTNSLARELDSTRQTGGVRCIQNSEMLEDVYTMNDFILSDSKLNPQGVHALRNPQNNTGLNKNVPYLVTEYAGHMFPTKRTDCETWQNEHVMRHLKVLDASFANPNISGSIAWCLFDYNTHRDFGSGDKICYHGVTDAFRLPKMAAYVYASQKDSKQQVILKPATYWTRGERPEANPLPVIILTNCDRVEVELVGQSRSFFPDRTRFAHLPHPPIIIDETNKADLPLGDWGYDWSDLTIRGYVDQELVLETVLLTSPEPTTLDISLQTATLKSHVNDCCRVVVRTLDQKEQLLPYFHDVLNITISDNLSIIGPSQMALEGGMASFWVRAHKAGAGFIRLSSQVFGARQVDMTVV